MSARHLFVHTILPRQTVWLWATTLLIIGLTGCASSSLLVGGAAVNSQLCDGIIVDAGSDVNAFIDQAELGDVLCLEPGTYRAPIRIGASITLAANGPGPVILDARGEGTTITIDAPTGQIALRGLTIMGGKPVAVGGGIHVTPGTEVSIQRCVLSGNQGGAEGGAALYASGAQVRIDQSRIVGNQSELGGSAILIDGRAQLVMRASLIAENKDSRSAPVRVLDGAQLSIFGSTITNNNASWSIELGGTSARPPSLRVNGAILSHGGGPILWIIEGVHQPTLRVQNTVLHGDGARIPGTSNHQADPRLDGSYRPGPNSTARGKLQGLPASWPSRDLFGVMRPSTPTLGAIE